MNPYVPLLFTLFVGVLGGFFDKTKKPDTKTNLQTEQQATELNEDSKAAVSEARFRLPQLTRAGMLLLFLYLGSFFFSLYTAYLNGKDTAKKAEDARQEATRANERADSLQRELAETKGKLDQLRSENLQQFKGVGEHLTQTATTVANQLDRSAAELISVIDQSGTDLDLTTRGSAILLNSFFLSVFDVSQASDYALWGGLPSGELVTAQQRKLLSEPFAELSNLACHAPAPMKIELMIPLSEEPRISLLASTAKNNGECHTLARLEAGSPFAKDRLTATSQSWRSGYVSNSAKTLWRSNARFSSVDLRAILDRYRVSNIAFRPNRSATIRIAAERPEALYQLRAYAVSHLPRVVGFHLRPSLDDGSVPLDEFETERSFVLESMGANFTNTMVGSTMSIGSAIGFYYRPQKMRPEWSQSGKRRAGMPAPEISIENPYRDRLAP